ncbi:MAG: T9SS type A sorting domain-containing protein [Thermaurantimonas sp.]
MKNRTVRLLVYFASLTGLLSQAQMREQLAVPTKIPLDKPSFKTSQLDTIELPIIDDFSYSSVFPEPSFWADHKVMVNPKKGAGMITIGVATFDGLDEHGKPYHPNKMATDTCDILTSRFINLLNRTNVFISFYYQPGGYGEPPETNDSLTLYFWSPSDSSWHWVWGTTGSGNMPQPFRQVILPIDQNKFLQKGFRFRFISYGAPSGAFDEWHLDYVRLDANRTENDTLISDPSFTRAHPDILNGNFSAIPWWVYSNNLIRNEVTHRYRKNGQPGTQNLVLAQYRAFYNNTLIASGNGNPSLDDAHPYNTEIAFVQPFVSPITVPMSPTNEFSILVESFFAGANAGILQNDTVRHNQEFRNYYSYDDGSAERAFGIIDQAGAITLVNFTPLTPDTLVGLYLNFVYAGVDAAENDFKIVVYQNNQGVPGAKLYESPDWLKPFYPPVYQTFVEYPLGEPMFINTPVFIGVKQRTIQPLNIGFDLHSPQRHLLVFGDGANWFQSIFEGSLMLRPYFRYQPLNLSIEQIHSESEVIPQIYPNPICDVLYVEQKVLNYTSVQVVSFSGQVLHSAFLTESRTAIPLGHLPSGFYLLQLYGSHQKSPVTMKVLKAR